MLSSTLRSKIDTLWNRFWAGGIANPLTAMEQISYLLFMRRLDEADKKRKGDAEYLGKPYTSIFAGHEDCRWSHFRHLPGAEMLLHIQTKAFPYVKELKGAEHPFARHMKDAVFLVPKASLVVEAVTLLDEVYTEIERERKEQGQTFHDTQGDIYEYLLSEIATAGKNGQFRTPRHIIQMIAALVDPKLGQEVCDPACGTGGFLLGAYQHILTEWTSPKFRVVDENGMERGLLGDKLTDEKQWKALRERTFHGYDFDATMVRIGLMNLMLHGIDQAAVDYTDTLGKKYTDSDCYDVILANPPFKGSIDKGDINEALSLKTTKTELLFVNRIINLLRVGGKAGVIVPDGVLFGSSGAHVDLRKMLIDSCELQGIVSMPSGVFRPYAGVSTAVLVFAKGGRTENVWFYDMQADGYTLDDKRDKIAQNDIPDVIARWKARDGRTDTDRGAKAFIVPVAEIKANKYDLSINRYKKVVHQHTDHEPPKLIMARMRALEREIAKDMTELEGMLG